MRIALDTSDENSIIAENILSLFMSHAKSDLHRILYDEKERLVEIPVSRRAVEFKSTLFGARPRYQKAERQALLRIKNVENYEIRTEEHLIKELHGTFTILFGLRLTGHTIFLSSAEENQGKQMLEIIISVSDVDIELIDV